MSQPIKFLFVFFLGRFHFSFFLRLPSLFFWGRLHFYFIFRLSSFFIFCWGRLHYFFCLHFLLRSSSISFWGRLSSLVKTRLHTKNQLLGLPGSALKVPVGGWCGVGQHITLSIPTLGLGWVGLWAKATLSTSCENKIKILSFVDSVYCYQLITQDPTLLHIITRGDFMTDPHICLLCLVFGPSVHSSLRPTRESW